MVKASLLLDHRSGSDFQQQLALPVRSDSAVHRNLTRSKQPTANTTAETAIGTTRLLDHQSRTNNCGLAGCDTVCGVATVCVGNSTVFGGGWEQNSLRFAAIHDGRSLLRTVKRLAHVRRGRISLFAILRHRLRQHLVQFRRDRRIASLASQQRIRLTIHECGRASQRIRWLNTRHQVIERGAE